MVPMESCHNKTATGISMIPTNTDTRFITKSANTHLPRLNIVNRRTKKNFTISANPITKDKTRKSLEASCPFMFQTLNSHLHRVQIDLNPLHRARFENLFACGGEFSH